MVHCASLVHDDLPALDNDDMRRGKPSLHKAFGEAAAVLVGDLLIPWAFRLITTSAPSELIKLKLADSLASGWQKVCYGQYLDTLPPNDRPDPLTINRYKTAALFECAANFAAIALETNEPTGKLFSNFGSEVGMLFQALDDFTDLFGSDVQRGRCGSSDDRNAKKTCLTGRTVEESQDLLSAHRMRVHDLLRELETNFSTKKFGNTAGLLGTLTTPPNHPRLTHTSRGACG
ncbi:MAG: hypothetical protein DCC75_12080 [Proteobacteria bacterium]|nr:MAG: hypothetical protein DCC75_12080 [Pseudomonadota bacterium]